MLVHAQPSDLEPYITLLERTAATLTAAEIRQWLPGSIRAQMPRLRRALENGELFVVRAGDVLAGGVLVSEEPDPIWDDFLRERAGYLSKLVVDRDIAPQKLGVAIMADVERIARERGYAWLRLDCVADNLALTRYYQALGYYPRGIVATSVAPLHRHEKELLADPIGDFLPTQRATLLFVQDAERVLLIHKKRGHGAGKINGPGGRVEAGESPLDAAVRETKEEVGIDVLDARAAAELRFRDPAAPSLLGYVFVASRFRGNPIETAEAVPFWCSTSALPFEQMWADDRLWLPRVLEARKLIGDFLMNDDRVRAHRIEYVDVLAF